MPDVKFQAYQGNVDTADRRGPKRLGKDTQPVDRHKTLFEYRIPAEVADAVIARLDQVNEIIVSEIAKADLAIPADVASLLLGGEGPVKMGFRVYDND